MKYKGTIPNSQVCVLRKISCCFNSFLMNFPQETAVRRRLQSAHEITKKNYTCLSNLCQFYLSKESKKSDTTAFLYLLFLPNLCLN